jgi:tryptophanyl-tRNA synthetase
MFMNKRILSGMRPTGRLHLGHWVGALSNWVKLQRDYECFFMVADWHALMSEYKEPGFLKEAALENVADWLSWGIDPEKSVIFVQSEIKEHLNLFMVLSALTALGKLYRCPTFKEQITQLSAKEINTYAFLGYPVLQAADIMIYQAGFVPVGEDQLPHLELARELVRRFCFLYKKEDVLVEPLPILTDNPRLLGLDGRKMSKSYNNCIFLSEEDKDIQDKINKMVTDPDRIRKTDPGHPQVCNVFSYYQAIFPDDSQEVKDWCSKAERGCRECKSILACKLSGLIGPAREKKRSLLQKPEILSSILAKGKIKAQKQADITWQKVKKTLNI